MTSITMKGGTALRAEAPTSRFARSSIISRPPLPTGRDTAPLPPHLTDFLPTRLPPVVPQLDVIATRVDPVPARY
jgi:hypothetical protein